MPIIKIDGKNYSGSTSYASAITYTAKDGSKTTVQEEIDRLKESGSGGSGVSGNASDIKYTDADGNESTVQTELNELNESIGTVQEELNDKIEMISLTQTEYDNLSEEEKNREVLYHITDGTSSGGGSSSGGGNANNASSITYTKSDGEVSNVQSELDNINESLGEDENNMTVHQKLDMILNSSSSASSAYLVKVSNKRTFNISNLVGADNLDKYSSDDFIAISDGTVEAETHAVLHQYDSKVWVVFFRTIFTKPAIVYDKVTGDVTITGGTVKKEVDISFSADVTHTVSTELLDINYDVYMLVKTPTL